MPLLAEKMLNFGQFWAILSLFYALFVAPFTGLNSVVVPQNDKPLVQKKKEQETADAGGKGKGAQTLRAPHVSDFFWNDLDKRFLQWFDKFSL